MLSILTQVLRNRLQHVMVDGYGSKLVNVVLVMLQGSILGPLLFLLYTSEHFFILKNKLIGYAEDYILMDVASSPGVRVAVAKFLVRDLGRVSECCYLRGMKLNSCMINTIIISMSRTLHPQSLLLELCLRILMNLIYWE